MGYIGCCCNASTNIEGYYDISKIEKSCVCILEWINEGYVFDTLLIKKERNVQVIQNVFVGEGEEIFMIKMVFLLKKEIAFTRNKIFISAFQPKSKFLDVYTMCTILNTLNGNGSSTRMKINLFKFT